MPKFDTCSFGEGVACVLVLLVLAGALIWMDNATTKELTFVLVGLVLAVVAVVAGLIGRRIRRTRV